MKAMIVDDSFTATSEQQMRDFAAAYKVYVQALEIAGDNKELQDMLHKAARNAMGRHFETSKKCYELMYA